MTTQNICRECKHFIGPLFYEKCARRIERKVDVVTGFPSVARLSFCYKERQAPLLWWGRGKCGPDGKFFTPKLF